MSHAATVLDLVGHSPIVQLRSLVLPGCADIFAKCEQRNPGGSIKDRIALAMIEAAEADGQLGPGSVVIESTSGNTGIGLAMVCAIKGYRCVLAMPEDMSLERRKLLSSFGAELLLTPADGGMYAAVEVAEELSEKNANYFMPRQFDNENNPRIHYETTGQEILAAMGERTVDALVCGVGTGGTITGVGRALRERHPDMRIVAVEPESSPVLSGGQPGVHLIQGIGAGFIPRVLQRELLDEVITVSDDEALRTQQLLVRREGLNVGVSAGAAVYVAVQVAESMGVGKSVMTVLPDTGERYLSSMPNPM